ncbi:MAG TPA: hypothetical protein VMT50_03165, partial [Steroidobacteraceae bacterium]|nr:hypothetical protein [Steroidobacteraceae bacterium]
MLSAIVAVTLLVPDVHAAERAYARALHYQTVAHGRIASRLADTWAAPFERGAEFVLMQPANGAPVYLRFIASHERAPPALHRLGWNATEILVEDPPALEQSLAGTAFHVVGPASPLEVNPAVIAMQALGPAGEMLYFTRIPQGQSKFGLDPATTFVDHVFIVVLGVHDLTQTLEFYSKNFDLPVTAPA